MSDEARMALLAARVQARLDGRPELAEDMLTWSEDRLASWIRERLDGPGD